MKQNSGTMMDFLLRRHARKSRPTHAAARGEGVPLEAANRAHIQNHSTLHLDADELAAFAENAVPAAARARYATHLADCDACRSILISLAHSDTPDMAVHEPVSVNHAPTHNSLRDDWREMLAAFWSPRGLRFAAPAFAVLAVGIIIALIAGVTMRRSRHAENLVASNSTEQSRIEPNAATNEARTPANTSATETPAANTPTTAASGNAATANKTSIASATPTANAKDAAANLARPDINNRDAIAAVQNAPAAASTNTRSAARNEGRIDNSDDVIKIERQNPAAVAQLSSPPPASPVSNANASADAPKFAGENSVATAGESARIESSNAERPAASAGSSAPVAKSEPAKTAAKSRASRATANTNPNASTASERNVVSNNADKASVTRRVRGREFRRQGNGWIDTAYTSSQPLTNVARGSEQYRALIADEPAIGEIANQLGGDIIVVWKRRAYRIR